MAKPSIGGLAILLLSWKKFGAWPCQPKFPGAAVAAFFSARHGD